MGYVTFIILLTISSTQPATRAVAATQPTVEQQLRIIIGGLQQQVAALKDENADLRRQVAQAAKQQPANKTPAAKIDPDKAGALADQVKPGMTEDEVKAILGSPYPWEKSDSSGRKTLKWMFHPDGVMGWDITIDFKDGKVQRVEKFYG
jgi:hypothetical protein